MTSVDPGSWVVFAKTTVVQTETGASNGYTRCTLDAGGASTDYAESEVGGGGGEARRATLQTNVLAMFASPGTIVLRCRTNGSSRTTVARQTKIIAVQVDGVTRTAVTG
jgi:hypothetical protein